MKAVSEKVCRRISRLSFTAFCDMILISVHRLMLKEFGIMNKNNGLKNIVLWIVSIIIGFLCYRFIGLHIIDRIYYINNRSEERRVGKEC